MRVSIILLSFFYATLAFAEINENRAEEIVKTSICVGDQNIDGILRKKIKRRSQRDLGWRVYKENGQFDVERAILISKSMRIRYRWRVSNEGKLKPVSKRAEKLCSEE